MEDHAAAPRILVVEDHGALGRFLQVYDRVVSSGSVPTLVMLTVALAIALLAMGGSTARAPGSWCAPACGSTGSSPSG